jgi:hypothetical protein
MVELATAFVRIRSDTSGFQGEAEKQLTSAGTRAGMAFGDAVSKNATTRFKGLRGALATAGGEHGQASGKAFAQNFTTGLNVRNLVSTVSAGFALIGGVHVFAGFISEARESINTSRLTAAALKATGGAAHVTADDVGNLAAALSNKVGVDDEAIQSAENLLLTFKGVRNEAGAGNAIFNRTSSVIVDMTAAMNNGSVTTEGMKASTIQLGKALNDPIKGLSALSRVGVTFSKQQKDQITQMVAAGNTLGAQKVILKEVESEFGGAAAAAADPVQKMSVAWGNFQETVGLLIMPLLARVATWFAGPGLAGILSFGRALGTQLGPTFARLGAFARALLPVLLALLSRFMALARTVSAEVGPPLQILASVVFPVMAAAIGGIVVTLGSFASFLSGSGAAATILRGAIYGLIGGFVVWKTVTLAARAATAAWAAVQWILDAALNANPIGLVVLAIGALIGVLILAWRNSSTFRNIVTSTWNAIRTGFQVMWSYLGPILGVIFRTYLAALRLEFRIFWSVVSTAWSILSTGFRIAWTYIGPILGTLFRIYIRALVLEFRLFWAVVTTVWAGVRNAIVTAYNILRPILAVLIKSYIAALRFEFNLFRSVAFAVWNAVRSAIVTAYNIIKPIISFLIKNYLAALRLEFNFFRSVVSTVWSAVRSASTAAWNVLNTIFGRIRSGLSTVAGAFRTGATAIGSAWGRIKDLTKAPVNFVIGTVFNRGIVGLWNKVTGWLHLTGLGLGTIPLLAEGGAVPASPGKYNRPTAIVGEGRSQYPEYVIPTDPKYRGRAQALWQAAGGQMQMLQIGGVLGWVKGVASHVINLGKDALALLANPGSIWDKLVASMVPSSAGLKTSPFGSAIAAIPPLILNQAKAYALQIFKSFSAGFGGNGMKAVEAARSQIGLPYTWGGGGINGPSRGFAQGANTVGFDCSSLMEYAWYQASHKDITRTTSSQRGFLKTIGSPRPGAVGQPHPGHTYMFAGNGHIIEAAHTGTNIRETTVRGGEWWGWPPWLAAGGVVGALADAFVKTGAGNSVTAKLLGLAGDPGGVLPGYGPLMPFKKSMIGGLFDSGGWGRGWPFHSNKPEPVFSSTQWTAISALASRGSRPSIAVTIQGLPEIPSDVQVARGIDRVLTMHGSYWSG